MSEPDDLSHLAEQMADFVKLVNENFAGINGNIGGIVDHMSEILRMLRASEERIQQLEVRVLALEHPDA